MLVLILSRYYFENNIVKCSVHYYNCSVIVCKNTTRNMLFAYKKLHTFYKKLYIFKVLNIFDLSDINRFRNNSELFPTGDSVFKKFDGF